MGCIFIGTTHFIRISPTKSTFSTHSLSFICIIQFFFVPLHPVMNHAGACGWDCPPNTPNRGTLHNILEGVYWRLFWQFGILQNFSPKARECNRRPVDVYILRPLTRRIIHIGVGVIVYSWLKVLLEPYDEEWTEIRFHAFLISNGCCGIHGQK